jgi:hypothetical protein
MDEKQAKRGYELARKEMEEKEVEMVKALVLATLRKIESVKERIRDLKAERDQKMKDLESAIAESEKEIKNLQLDITDLKQGHPERIEERQRLDKRARESSVIIIEKVVEREVVPMPYPVPYPVNPVPSAPHPWDSPQWPNVVYCGHANPSAVWATTADNSNTVFPVTEVASSAVIGAYLVGDNKVINIR